MNQLETMNFVDRATPQQLTAMVNARDPFSYMALSKLQQIRDQRMKAQAGQPAPAPLAQVIPQQVMQGAQPQAAPQMPQSMEQPPQMGIASLGGIGPDQEAAGAGGGMVAFTQGGGIKGYADGVLVGGANAEFRVSPQEQIQRDMVRLRMLTNELQSTSDPAQQAALQSEIANTSAAIQNAQSTGRFPQSMRPQSGNRQAMKVADTPASSFPEKALAVLTGSTDAQAATPTVNDASVDERPGYGGAAAAASLLGGAKAIEGINASRAADLARYNAFTDLTQKAPKPPITLGSAAQSTLSGIRNIGSTIGNVTKPLAAGVSRLPLLGTGYTAFADTLPTKTEDFRTRLGIERGDSEVGKYAVIDPEFYKDMGVRALGLGTDVLNNMTFGSLSRIFADQYDQNTGQKITKQKADKITEKVKEEAKKTVVPTDKIQPDVTKPDAAKPVEVDSGRQNINSLLAQLNASIGESDAAREGLAKAAEKRAEDSKVDLQAYDRAIGDPIADRKRIVEEFKTLFPNPNDDLKKQLDELKAENKSATEQAPYQGLLKMGLALMANKSPYLANAVGEAGASGLEEYSRIQSLNKQEKAKLLEADSRLAQANDLRNQNQFAMADKEARLSQEARKDRYRIQHDAKVAAAGLAFQVAQVRAGFPEEKARMAGLQLNAALQIHTILNKKPEQQLLFEAINNNPAFAEYMQTEKDAAAVTAAFLKFYAQQDDQSKAQVAAGNPPLTHSEMITRSQQAALAELQLIQGVRSKALGKVPGKQ